MKTMIKFKCGTGCKETLTIDLDSKKFKEKVKEFIGLHELKGSWKIIGTICSECGEEIK